MYLLNSVHVELLHAWHIIIMFDIICLEQTSDQQETYSSHQETERKEETFPVVSRQHERNMCHCQWTQRL